MTGDAERERAVLLGGCLSRQDLAILDRLHQAEAEHRRRNAEGEVPLLQLHGEVRLSEGALRDRRVALDPFDGPQLVHAAVGDPVAALVAQEIARCGIDLVDEAHLARRAELLLEDGHDVLLAETVRDEVELWVLRRLRWL